MQVKVCTTCNVEKPVAEIAKFVYAKDGLSSSCKMCRAANSRAWHSHNGEKRRDTVLTRKYGISHDDYMTILSRQGFSCAICLGEEVTKDPLTGKRKHLAVDHCHKTGKVRGLLCNNCNRAIGLLKDSKKVLLSAVAYLTEDEQDALKS